MEDCLFMTGDENEATAWNERVRNGEEKRKDREQRGGVDWQRSSEVSGDFGV